jgi:hypothetical protein
MGNTGRSDFFLDSDALENGPCEHLHYMLVVLGLYSAQGPAGEGTSSKRFQLRFKLQVEGL